jgi:hypothetical protein
LFSLNTTIWAVKGRITNKRLEWKTKCKHCGLVLLTGEKAGFCCGTTNIKPPGIPRLQPLPVEFNIFINDPNISALSRELNLVFSFASMETSALFPSTHGGMFAVQGRIYHRVRPTHTNSSVRWILYDGMHPSATPHARFADPLNATWLEAMSSAMRTHNPIARKLITMHAAHSHGIAPETMHLTLRDPGTATEVAAIISVDNTSLSDLSPRSAVVIRRDGEAVQVPITSALWEPLAYPLFFPHGQLGWGVTPSSLDTPDRDGSDNVSTTQMWYYRLLILHNPRFRIFGRLTNEFLVDMFARSLDCRLNYIHTNMKRIQREDAELMGEDSVTPNENIYLPASFLGSIRWSHERTADALTVARAKGPPTFFITFTCNPKWDEITEQLRPGQLPHDIPEVVARVFKQKQQKFMHILKHGVFPGAGKVDYIVSRIEFQKRGLPHN